jgi:flagellin
MPLRINTDMAALTAHRIMAQNDVNLSQSLQRLSSGLRINSASDDAAGLAIAQKLDAQVRGLNQAASNAQDGINFLQTADGALGETQSILQRMRELAVQGANDTLTASDRSNITAEMNQLSAEVDRIASATQFNNLSMLAGSNATTQMSFQIGANGNQVLYLTFSSATATALSVMTTQLSVDTAANASTTIGNIDSALDAVSQKRSTLGAAVNRLQHTVTNLQVQSENMAASESRIRDLDVAAETANMTRYQVLSQWSQAMLSQANQHSSRIIDLLK